ncbi:hypothetical protein KSP40_PGU009192 [Platanthera guangdongensis]|uniref:C3H1-type domain-containing protein n=1 Tax=Platanthera guangdongensis TaxID=2320717 RepID=A0ABR2ME95_9ASPA
MPLTVLRVHQVRQVGFCKNGNACRFLHDDATVDQELLLLKSKSSKTHLLRRCSRLEQDSLSEFLDVAVEAAKSAGEVAGAHALVFLAIF